MRGKKATQAANRRAEEAASALGEAQALLKEERAAHRREVVELRAEIQRLRTDASRIAQAEVERTLKRIEDERRMRGMSDDISRDLLYQKDKFVLNACRYISMTKGEPPHIALNMVMAWLLDEDFYGPLNRVNLLVRCGLPSDGWVAQQLTENQHLRRRWAKLRVKEDRPAVISLDRAEREGHEDIHPDYNPRWYPRVEYSGMTVLDDEGNSVSESSGAPTRREPTP